MGLSIIILMNILILLYIVYIILDDFKIQLREVLIFYFSRKNNE